MKHNIQSFFLFFLLLMPLAAVSAAPGDSSSEAIVIEVGTTEGSIDQVETSKWYEFAASNNTAYEIALSADIATDFDLYLYDENENLLDSSDETSYPELITFATDTSATYYIEVFAYDGTGSFTLTITETELPSGEGYEFDKPESITVGEYTRTISTEGYSYYFAINLTTGLLYEFRMDAGTTTDFDLYLLDMAETTLESSLESTYPEIISYEPTENETVIIEIYAYTGSGSFDLSISNKVPLPDYYRQVPTDVGFVMYEITSAQDVAITIELERLGMEYHAAFVDTDFSISVLYSLLGQVDEIQNPHLLYDTYTDHSEGMVNITDTFTSPVDTLYLIIYSLEVFTSVSQSYSGFLIKTNVDKVEIAPSDDLETYLPNEYENDLYQNGDEYWDGDEWYVLSDITIPAGEIFDALTVVSETAEVGVLLMEGSTADALNDAIYAYNSWDGLGDISSDVYAGGASSGLVYITYKPTTTITANLVVFSNNIGISSTESVVMMSHKSSGGVNQGSDNTDAAASSMYLVLFSFSIFVLIYRRKYYSS